MKILIILLIAINYSDYISAVSFLDFMSTKLTEFASTISSSFSTLKTRVKKYFLNQIVGTDIDPGLTNVYNNIREARSKYTFSDFVEKVAAESETEVLEYASYKSEPTALMSTPQLAILHGRRVESHVIQTEDGYLLTLHRVQPVFGTNVTSINETVFLHHGLLGSSADWIFLGPKDSLPYILSNMGYDVWLANARGNYYSRGHMSIRVDSLQFWKFTWHEMGQHDLMAAVEYIRQLKNMSKPINYIGHSMGATALLVLLSSKPQYNKYFKIGILLAPLAFMTNTKGPLRVLAHMSKDPPQMLLQAIGKGEFIPSRKIPKWLVTKYCSGHTLFCSNPLFFLTGGIIEEEWNSSFIGRVLYHVPAGGSTDTILHYAQLIKSGKFHQYNDQTSEYPLNKVKLPIVLFSSNGDQLASVSDVLRLYFSIGNPIDHYIIQKSNFGHTDFIWGSEATSLVFVKILDYLENGTTWNLFKINEVL